MMPLNIDPTPDAGDSDNVLLRKIAMALSRMSGGATAEKPTAGVSITSETTDGEIQAGKSQISILISQDFTGSIGGQSVSGASVDGFSLNAPAGASLPALAYVVTTGSLLITTIE